MLLWRYLCFIQFFVLLITYTFLGLTGDPGEYVPIFNDKLMHCSGYIVAGISISFAFPLWQYWVRASSLILFSIGIEIGQHFLPPRTFDLWDICANSIGVILGLTIIFTLNKYWRWFNQFLHLSQRQQASL